MPRSRKTLGALSALGLLALAHLAVPAVAAADEVERPLEITIDEGDGQTVVHVRDPGGTLSEPKIATSHRGFMLSFEGEVVVKDAQRTNGWRLGRVQTGQYGDRAVVRLIQRKGRRGAIDDHAQVIAVDDGLDIVVVDRLAPPPPMKVDAGLGSSEAAPTEGAALDQETAVPTTAQTVAALQNELGPLPEQPDASAEGDASPLEAEAETSPTETDPTTATQPEASPDAEQAALAATDDDAGFALDDAPADPAAAGPFVSGEGEPTTPASFAAWTLIPSILALGGLGLWMRRRKQTIAGSALEVVAKTSLGPKQQIVQVKVDGRELLLGVTEHQIGLITEVGAAPTASTFSAGASTRRHSGTASAPTSSTSSASTHHEFGVPAPVMDRTDAAASNRIDAFKSRLSSALRTEVASNDTGEATPAPAAATRPADLGELRRLLDRRGEDPAWAREDVA